MLVPVKIIDEVSKKDENLGYYINTNSLYIKKENYKIENSFDKHFYDAYDVEISKVPTLLLEQILTQWDKYERLFKEKNKENSEVIQKLDEEKSNLKKFVGLCNLSNINIEKPKNIDNAFELFHAFFRTTLKDNKNAWIYRKDFIKNRHYPFVVKGIRLVQDNYDMLKKWIEIELINNSQNKTRSTTVLIDSTDLKEYKNSIADVIRGKNILFETKELKKEYDTYIEDYNNKESLQNTQFIDSNKIKYINDNLFEKEKEKGRWDKLFKLFTSSNISSHSDNCRIPFEPLIYVYNLDQHEFQWQDTRDLSKYKFNDLLIDQLILPKEHKGLIDILTSDFIQDNGADIIDGKAGGTIILCKGKAGLGKTLTAEIYSEIKHKPLYSVHSGQLGTNGNQIEKKLKEAFEKAQRWEAILLIDEADVYIRQRDNDTNHNAIVASFLRVMEHYNGLMFMTTNRVNDIDDAILSRCMSVLTYKEPMNEVKRELWSIYLKQFNIKYTEVLLDKLCNEFVKISGRDIKNISRLASRYIQGYKLKEVTLDVFINCAVFRGVRELTSE